MSAYRSAAHAAVAFSLFVASGATLALPASPVQRHLSASPQNMEPLDRRPAVSVRDLVQFKRLTGHVRISPDGRIVAYAVAEADIERDSPDVVIYAATLPKVDVGKIVDVGFVPRRVITVQSLQDFQWTRDSAALVVLHQPLNAPRRVLTRVEALSGKILERVSPSVMVEGFDLEGDRSTIRAIGYTPPKPSAPDERGVVISPGDQSDVWLARVARLDAPRSTYILSGGSERLVESSDPAGRPQGEAERSALAAYGDVRIGIAESPTSPPELQMIVASTGDRRILTHLNPFLADRRLGRVELIEWKVGSRQYWGHIIYPIDYKEGERYPCALLAKSWTKDGFYFESQSTYPYGNYPAQALAGANIVVLMLGRGDIPHGDIDTPDAEGTRQGYYSARAELARRGLVDPAKCGLMGWSHTGWQVDYLVSHPEAGPPWAAAIAADHYTRDYAMGSLGWGYARDATMGPEDNRIPAMWVPYIGRIDQNKTSSFRTVDDVRAAYLERSAAWNASSVRTPILKVRNGEKEPALEMLNALSMRGKPVELVWMPGNSHTLEKPRQRLAAMQRMVDWFRFWLQGVERQEVSEDPERFSRWRKLRDLHLANEGWIAAGRDPNCQSACKRDPLSARKRDPLSRWRKVDRTRAFALRAA